MLLCAQYVLPITSEPIPQRRRARSRRRYPRRRNRRHAQVALSRRGNVRLRSGGAAARFRRPAHAPGKRRAARHRARRALRNVDYDHARAVREARCGRLVRLRPSLAAWKRFPAASPHRADIPASGASCTATQKLGMRSVIYREVGAMDRRNGFRHAPGRKTTSCTGAKRLIPAASPSVFRRQPCSRAIPRCSVRWRSSPRRRTCPLRCAWRAIARNAISCATDPRRFPCTPWTPSAASWRFRRGCPQAPRR